MTTDKPGDWETVFEESFHHHNRLLAIILSSARLFTILSTFHHHSCSFKSKLGVIKSNVIIIIDKSHRNLWFWLVNCWYDDPTTDCKWKLRFCICRFNLASESCGNIKQLRPASGNEIIFTTQSKGCTHPYTQFSSICQNPSVEQIRLGFVNQYYSH